MANNIISHFKLVVFVSTACCNIKELAFRHTVFLYVSHYSQYNKDYFSEESQPVGVCNGGRLCSV